MKAIFSYQRHYFAIFSYTFFLILSILAIVYAKERILISDPAYYFFNIVNGSNFFIPHTRHTAIINQVPLVLATRMQIPLYVLLPLYSVSFVLIRVLYFFIAFNLFKNKPAGFAIIAISAIGVAESYFRPTSESNLALLNSILLYAWLYYSNSKQNWGKWRLIISLFGTVLFIIFGYISHSIALFSLIFVIIYFSIEHKKLKTSFPYLAIFITLGIFLFHIFIGNNNADHERLYGNLLNSPLSILKEIESYYPYKYFFKHLESVFLPYLVLFVLAVFLQLRKMKWLSVAFLFLFSIFYFIVASTSFREGDSNMQMEKIFLPLTLFAALSFFESIREYSKRNQTILYIISVLVIIFGMSKINNSIPIYKKRISIIKEQFVNKADANENRKLVIDPAQVEKYPLVGDWAFGIETLLLSTLDENIEPLTIFIDQKSNIEERMNLTDNFMPALFQTSFNYKSLNKTYFELPKQKYIRWNMDSLKE